MDDNLAVIDQQICIHCGECVKVCPTNSISEGLLAGMEEEKARRAAVKAEKEAEEAAAKAEIEAS